MKYVSHAERSGFDKGFEKGFEHGLVVGKVQACQELLKQQPSPDAELFALSQEALAALLDQLRKQILSNGHSSS